MSKPLVRLSKPVGASVSLGPSWPEPLSDRIDPLCRNLSAFENCPSTENVCHVITTSILTNTEAITLADFIFLSSESVGSLAHVSLEALAVHKRTKLAH